MHLHTLLHVLVHARHTDAELILEQLAYATQTAVAQVVDIIHATDAVAQAQQIVDGLVYVEQIADQRGKANSTIATVMKIGPKPPSVAESAACT